MTEENTAAAARTDDFDYDLPDELIAQVAAEPRDSARMLVLNRSTGALEHRRFSDLQDYLLPGDCVVINDTKVMPSRIRGERVPSGGQVEALLLRELAEGRWETLMKPGKRLKEGARLLFGPLQATVAAVLPDGRRVVDFDGDIRAAMHEIGTLPLPPYISNPDEENPAAQSRYQTVYADREASAAAPTAGLHFTPEMMELLRDKGVGFARVTLEIGWETFRPVRAEYISDHQVHTETYSVTAEAADLINTSRSSGGRIIAVGTTATRVLETMADTQGIVRPGSGETSLFITPGYRFKAVDAMITNFHLPRTSLLMLISAFAGRERVLSAYAEAIKEQYRFYSFGDASLIIG